MTVKPYLIASYEVGLEKDMEPWLLPDTAFPFIEDAYVWRKRVKRRLGNRFLGRLVTETELIYPLAVNGAATSYTNSGLAPNGLAIADLPITPFSVRVTIDSLVFVDDGNGNMLNSLGVDVGDIDYYTGEFDVSFSAIGGGPYNVNFLYSFFPCASVMGLLTWERPAINVEDLIAFDLTKANLFNTGTDFFNDISFYDTSEEPIDWSGTDTDFFDNENYQNAMFETNFIPATHTQTITNITPGNPTVITFAAGNILQVGDTVYLDDIVGTIGTGSPTVQGLNGRSFVVTARTDTTITIAVDTTTLVYTSGGFAGILQHSGFNLAQSITNVLIDTPAAGQTRLVFAANAFSSGDVILITGVTGTVGDVLNNKKFTVTNPTATTVDIAVTSTGVAYTSGGQAFRLIGDGIRWYTDDASVDGWVNFQPMLAPTVSATAPARILKGGRILIAYKDRMIVLSPIEGSAYSNEVITYSNRARWCQNGTVFYSNPVPDNESADGLAWRDDIPGRGGFIDAPTNEAIVSAQYIRDTLIVFFERSTWALRYNGNEALPFIWVRVNVEFGSESQFSTVPFDRGVLTVGQRGIITADGNNVSRIDLQIPYQVFEFLNQSTSTARVHGIRDYYNELVFWTYVDSTFGNPAPGTTLYPNKLLVYNYRENSYSIFNDSYTCFGYYQSRRSYLWNTTPFLWNEADFFWNSAQGQQLLPDIVAGTNTGYVMILSKNQGNERQIAIENITQAIEAVVTTCGEHNLATGQYVKFQDVQGMTEINGLNTEVEILTSTTFRCLDIDSTNFTPYTVGGELSRINNFKIVSKRFNPFANAGQSVALNKMDLFTDYVEAGRIAVNIFMDENSSIAVNEAAPGQNQFWQTVFPLDQTVNDLAAEKTWTRMFIHSRGQFVQICLTQNKEQLLDDNTNVAQFVLHGMILYLGGTGRLISK